MMQEIKQLPKKLIAKIAAGQVVERPASVVKELVENSIDAGAKNILIELEQAGKKKIILTDDGFGMNPKNLNKCFLHHTTSKIFSETELYSLMSFGFRGEALSSISAVAKIKIETKTENALGGTYIELSDGTVTDSGSVGMPKGTRITVSGLFSGIPARKKFLKSDSTEYSHILRVLSQLALAHTNVSFTLIHNKKSVFKLPQPQSTLERSQILLSDHISSNLLPLKINAAHFSLKGFIGKPQIATPSKMRQFLFVNGRPVQNSLVSKRIKEVYGTLIEPRSNPAFVLFLTLAPDLIDVNIDPQKTQVKFLILKEILSQLEIVVKHTLEKANLTVSKEAGNGFYEEFVMDKGIASSIKTTTQGWNINQVELLKDTEILQVNNVYLFVPTKRGILIVDQHAAHERILYQEFLEVFNSKRSEILKLSKAVPIKLMDSEYLVLEENKKVFEELGFKFNLEKKLVIQIPKLFETKNIQKLIQEMVHDIIYMEKPKELDVGTHRTLAYLACRSAVKAGDRLTPKERRRLIEKLQKTETKYTCPHGRPVEVELDIKYLDKLFKRTK